MDGASLSEAWVSELLGRLSVESHPPLPEDPARRPLHTVYWGAQFYRAEVPRMLGALALDAVSEYGSDPVSFASAVGLTSHRAGTVHARMMEKLRAEPIEDLRLDFEDDFGQRSDKEEDECAVAAASELSRGAAAGLLPPFVGIRIKSLSGEQAGRALRTLAVFVGTVVRTSGRVPDGFRVTLPKITHASQVEVLTAALDALEHEHRLGPGVLKLELLIETPRSVISASGLNPLPALVAAASGRAVAAHFGPYDFTAACDVLPSRQRLSHPICELGRQLLRVGLAGTGLWLSDGVTHLLPQPPHAPTTLTVEQRAANRDAVHRAWKEHVQDIRHAFDCGFYQGWDVHSGQLPTRVAATYDLYLEALPSLLERLGHLLDKATYQAPSSDERAAGQRLLAFLHQAVWCGAVRAEETVLPRSSLRAVDERRFSVLAEAARAAKEARSR